MVGARFGAFADILRCPRHVRFTTESDICSATSDVRFVPIADIVPSCLRQMHFDVIVTLLARQRDLACQRGGDLQVGCAIGDRGSVDTPSDEIVRRF